MPTIKNFDHTTEALLDLLRSAKEGKTQLPDFQRPWIWKDEQIRNILASVSLSYPIGVVMMLQTGNTDMRFQAHPIQGVTLNNPKEPERLILDGQQRLTSLFQALVSGKPVKTKDARGKEIYRWYYIDIVKALDSTDKREEAIISLPEDKISRYFGKQVDTDCSQPEKEYEQNLFPVAQIFDCYDWMRNYNEFWHYDKEKFKLFNKFHQEIIQPFEQYQIPVILLKKETPREAVCHVFEKVNQGGVELTVFELLTATFAVDYFKLGQDWENREKQLKKWAVLETVYNTDFIQAVTLVATRDRREQEMNNGCEPHKLPAIGCTRKDILALKLAEYEKWADAVTSGFEKAAKLLHTQKIFSAKDLPYQPQLTVLAAIFAVLKERSDSDSVLAKLVRWYWCGVFGELYSSAIESRIAKDLPQVLKWIELDESEPDTIKDANFSPNRLLRLYTRRSAAYKGLSALLLRDGGYDFLTGYQIDTLMHFGDSIDIHHIFPRQWCEKNGIKAEFYDSVVNKTPLSSRTNKIIGSNAPSVYLSSLQKKASISEERMDEIVRSHVINPNFLRADDFDNFLQQRQNALLERIEKAMGKTLVSDTHQLDDTELVDFDE